MQYQDVLRCAMPCHAQVYRNMLHAAQGIVTERGVAGLYSGLGVTVLEIMPYAALQFGVYDALQAKWKDSKVRLVRCYYVIGIQHKYLKAVCGRSSDQRSNRSLVDGSKAKPRPCMCRHGTWRHKSGPLPPLGGIHSPRGADLRPAWWSLGGRMRALPTLSVAC